MAAEVGDELYELDPGDFTAARTELVRRLRAEQKRDDAAGVAKRRRPSALAWALDQVARQSPDVVEGALAAGARLRSATDAALAGDAAELRSATTEDHIATDAVVAAALARLDGADPGVRARLASTVRAAVLDEALADQLRRGVLVTDHVASSLPFGTPSSEGGLTATRKPRPGAARSERAAKSRAGSEAERRRQADKEREANEERDRKAAEERERAHRRQVAELDESARRAAARAERLAHEADAAETEAARLRAEADQAAREAQAAQAAADQAQAEGGE